MEQIQILQNDNAIMDPVTVFALTVGPPPPPPPQVFSPNKLFATDIHHAY